MNLWFRLIWLMIATRFMPRLKPPLDTSRLPYRVWPTDLDLSLHMNNGRYWTLMDQGRMDLMLRSGLWAAISKAGWTPVVAAGKIRFRRELRPFVRFWLETRILCWSDTTMVIEHRFISTSARTGQPMVNATALVRAGLYDRKAKAYVPVARILEMLGSTDASPAMSPEVAAFLAAEDAMKRAAPGTARSLIDA
jgi:acyl-CoA thioesterase FadM